MKKTALKWLGGAIGTKKYYIAILTLFHIFLGISGVIGALLLREAIDGAVSGSRRDFIVCMSAMAVLTAMQIAVRALTRRIEELSRSEYENLLKKRLFACLLGSDYASVTRIHSGEWLNRLTSDTMTCANGLTEIIPGICGMLVKLCGALVILIMLEPLFGAVILPGGGLLILLTYLFRKSLKSLHKRVQESDGRLRVFMQENLSSLMIIRSFAAEKQAVNGAQDRMNEHKSARMKKNSFSNLCNIGFSAAMHGMYLLGAGFCGMGILNGTVSYGTFTAVLQLVGQIQAPFANITGYMPKLYAMTASAERLMEAEDFAPDCPEGCADKDEIADLYRSEFKGLGLESVTFSYNSEAVLKNFRLCVKKGEFIAFMGASGCGKSTALRLLMCLYHLSGGERYLETEKGRLPLTSRFHRLFAYVPQGNMLMSGTVREIVAFSDEDGMKREDKLKRALEIACADEFVYGLENGIDTLLGEHGTGLSEGQMQRIAVARAVFSDNPILLLDEATSALDEDTERRMLGKLRKMTDKTVLIVTHRPAALSICDRIIDFSKGEI